MQQTFDRISPYFPWAGLFLVLAGAVVTLITRQFELANNLLLGGGALLLLLFAVARPGDVRELLSGRQVRYGSSTILSVLFFAAIAILLYWLAFQNTGWRIDTTETGQFTPLPETRDLLENLDDPVHVIGFYTVNLSQQQNEARTILESLSAYSGALTYEFVDPEANPLVAQEYDLNFNGTLVFIRNQGTANEVFSKANSLQDRDIHTALVKVVNPTNKKLYVITGHGEPAIDSFEPQGMGTIIGLLEDQGFTVEALNLFTAGDVPADATVVALIGPQSPLDPAEVAALRTYLQNGGAAFIGRDVIDSESRAAAEDDGLNQMLQEEWGIRLRPDVIVDQDLAQAGQGFGLSFLGADYGNSPIITEELRNFGTRFNLARSIETEAVEGTTITPLVTTSPEAWGETDFEMLVQAGTAEPNPEDAQGALTIGLSAENQSSGARLAVFGDADFVNNTNLVWGGNNLLFTNAMNWLANDEVAINLTPREQVDRQINIPEQQLRLMRLVSIWLGPLLLGVIGVVVWSARRQRQ